MDDCAYFLVRAVLDDTPLEEEFEASVLAHLSTLEEWLDDVKLLGHYWNSLRGDILTIRRQISWLAYGSEDFTSLKEKFAEYPDSERLNDLISETRAGIEAIELPGSPTEDDMKLKEAAEAALQSLADTYALPLEKVFAAVQQALADVDMTASDLEDGAGHTIDAANVTFFRQYFTTAAQRRMALSMVWRAI